MIRFQSRLCSICIYDMILQINRFIALATEHFWWWTRTRFVLMETNTLVDEHIENLRSKFVLTHSQLPAASKQNLY